MSQSFLKQEFCSLPLSFLLARKIATLRLRTKADLTDLAQSAIFPSLKPVFRTFKTYRDSVMCKRLYVVDVFKAKAVLLV